MKPAINSTLTGQIITLVCTTWGVTRADLVGPSRRRPLPWARSQLCEYLRRYAGHNTVSCGAILQRADISVCDYSTRYTHLLRTYTHFRDNDAAIHAAIKQLLAAPHDPPKPK